MDHERQLQETWEDFHAECRAVRALEDELAERKAAVVKFSDRLQALCADQSLSRAA